jgi:hypothetical protein
MTTLSQDDENRLRELATGLAKGVEDEEVLFTRLGFTPEDYQELSETRTFKEILRQATSEWEGASNTHKRIKLKAAVNVEQALPSFYQAMVDTKEPLSSRVKALEVVSRIGGLGMNEPVPVGTGQYFKLEINLGGGRSPLVIENVAVLEPGAGEESEEPVEEAPTPAPALGHYSRSKLWDDVPREEL